MGGENLDDDTGLLNYEGANDNSANEYSASNVNNQKSIKSKKSAARGSDDDYGEEGEYSGSKY